MAHSMRFFFVSMPVLALLSVLALGANARAEARTDTGLARSYLTPTLRRTLANIEERRLASWDMLPS